MQLHLSWYDVGLRLLLATVFGLLIGLNRDERGHPAGMRTTLLVCLAACLAQLQANLLLVTSGKTPASFSVLDLERLPLGILSGIGFIGAGVIMKRDHNTISGVTTAATIWFVTVLGLLFGGGQIVLGVVGAGAALAILWGLKYTEGLFQRQHSALVQICFEGAMEEARIRQTLKDAGCRIKQWNPTYRASRTLVKLQCEIAWPERADREPHTPDVILLLTELEGVSSLTWDE